MSKEHAKVFVNTIDLGKLSTLKTEKVKTESVEFDINNGLLLGAKFKVRINVFGLSPSSPDYRKKSSQREIRFSCYGGGYLSAFYNEAIAFPLQGRTPLEFEALNEFCLLLRDKLGLDESNGYEPDVPPPDELAIAQKIIRDLEDNLRCANREIELQKEKVKETAEIWRRAADEVSK